jgi:hypothetical protein
VTESSHLQSTLAWCALQAYVREDLLHQLLQKVASALDLPYALKAMSMYRHRPGRLHPETVNLYIHKIVQVSFEL